MRLRTVCGLQLLGAVLAVGGCARPEPAEHSVTLLQPAVVSQLRDDCAAIDSAMSYALLRRAHDKTPISPELEAADYWCRNQRLSETPTPGTQIPIVVQMNDRAFFGLVAKADVESAADSCQELAKWAGGYLAKSDPASGALVVTLSPGACANLRQEMLHDNPLVVLGGTVVVANGAVDSFLGLTEDRIPGLQKTMAFLRDVNDRFDTRLREAAQRPVYWVREHPKEAIAALNTLTAPLAIEQVREFAEKGVRRILETGTNPEEVKVAAQLAGGPIAAAFIAIVTNPLPIPEVPGGGPVDPCIVNPQLCAGKAALEAIGISFSF